MSSFDTLMDWREHDIPDAIAIKECLRYMKLWDAEVAGMESYQAITEIVDAMIDRGKAGHRCKRNSAP